jgi:8-oxo-dGTP diphosphatase
MKRIPTSIEVVAVALIDQSQRVLLQLRRADRQHGGLWEFPGGKLEARESAVSGLIREIEEELGIALTADELFRLDQAEDPESGIVITLYTCRSWVGEPRCLDAAAIDWFAPAQIAALALPPLDRPLAAALEQWLRKG